MAGAQIVTRCGIRLRAAVLIVAMALGDWAAWGQKPDQPTQLPIETLLQQDLPQVPPQPQREMVVELRIVGNRNVPVEKVITFIRTRAGRPYDPEVIEEDVRRLMSDRGHHFVSVRPLTQKVPGGRIVTFELVERPVMGYVKYVGNQAYKKKVLASETGLKPGDAMDPFAVEEGRRRMMEYYHTKGYSKVQIQIFEGNKPSDRGVIYVINEGPKQRYLWTSFEGNTIANDGRLRTQIQSKPGFLWFFRGEVDRKQIDEDIKRLTAYYRSLGFFRAQVGRKLDFNDAMNWLSLTFVIDEGPRYRVRNIVVMGNKRFSTGRLQRDAKLQAGEYFDQAEMTADTTTMTDLYGSIGYVFANVNSSPRFLDVPGQVDLVYNVKEGRRYRVGKINVDIKGEYPHTRIHTVLNRMSIRPGEIVDTRELRNSERRLKASGLFAAGPGTGPKIVFTPPDLDRDPESGETPQVADRPGGSGGRGGRFRGQSPDVQPYRAMRPTGEDDEEELVDLVVLGELLPGKSGGQDEPLQDPRMAQIVGKRTGQPRQSQEYFVPASPEGEPLLPGHTLPGEVPFEQRPREIVTPDDTGVEASLPPGTIVRGQQPDATSSQLDTSGWQAYGAPSTTPSASNATGSSSLRWGAQNQYTSNPQGAGNATTGANAAPNYGAMGINRNGVPATTAALQGASAAQPNADVYGGNGFSVPSFDSNSRGTSGRLQTMDPGADYRAPVGGRPTGTASTAPNSSYPTSSYPAGGVQTSNGIVTGTTTPAASPMAGDYRPVTQGNGTMPMVGSNVAFEQNRSVDRSVDRWLYRDPPDLMGRSPDQDPPLYLPLNPSLEETQTGRLMFSIGVNSDSGLVGSVVIDEQNFDWTRWPRGWEDIRNGTAWRGAGQRFRVEAAPGTSVSRYTMSFTEPYLFDTSIMLGLSGFFYQRIYSDQWTEERGGGRVTLGYQFLPDISGSVSYRGENVVISDPVNGNSGVVPPDIAAVVGANSLHGLGARLTLDKRDNQFLATEGYYVDFGFEQVLGSYTYSRGDIDFRKYFWTYERPDHSGRHVISLAAKFALTSDDTPVYDRYYAGGYSSIRGFSFRGVSPRYDGIAVGGNAMLMASAEYMFPITADDALRGVVFVDTGTIEPSLSNWNQKYRVAPGFGMRITIPAMGPAPIALDFAFPVSQQDGDDKQVFSFFIGFLR